MTARSIWSAVNFVKQASLGAAAVALSPLAAPYVQAQNGNNKVLKVGVVGLGGRGGGALKNILAADPNTKIWAVADIFENRIKRYEGNTMGGRIDTDGKKRIFLGFDGYQKVIDSGVDIVILATPPCSALSIWPLQWQPVSTCSWRNLSPMIFPG